MTTLKTGLIPMETLHRLKILITRPKHQSENLAKDIQAQGGIPIFFPTLEIVAAENSTFLSVLFKKIDRYDLVIFISPNAVLEAITYIHRFWPVWPKATKIIAMGSGTENTLKSYGLPVDYRPEKNFSSEGVLGLPVLQNPEQKKILLCQGEKGGLQLISPLEKRKAQVSVVNVYKRECPQRDRHCIPKQEEVDVIVCTSNTGLKNLVNLLQPYWHEALLDKQLLVISTRIADFVKKLGFVKAPLISDNASNEAILHLLKLYAKFILRRN